MVGARSAAMAFNRLADIRIDALNPRTRTRALPAGHLSRFFVAVFTLASGSVFRPGGLPAQPALLPPVLSPCCSSCCSTPIPSGSRGSPTSTWGSVWGLAPLGSWIAVRGEIGWPPLLLGLAVLLWTAGFDVIYACQDVHSDRRQALFSIPEGLRHRPGPEGVARAAHRHAAGLAGAGSGSRSRLDQPARHPAGRRVAVARTPAGPAQRPVPGQCRLFYDQRLRQYSADGGPGTGRARQLRGPSRRERVGYRGAHLLDRSLAVRIRLPCLAASANYLPMTAMPRFFTFDRLQPPVCRLGLATRGNTRLTGDDVLVALERGLNYWNWCGHQDGMAEAIRQLGPRRKQVLIAAQLWARDEQGVQSELQQVLDRLRIDSLDVGHPLLRGTARGVEADRRSRRSPPGTAEGSGPRPGRNDRTDHPSTGAGGAHSERAATRPADDPLQRGPSRRPKTGSSRKPETCRCPWWPLPPFAGAIC